MAHEPVARGEFGNDLAAGQRAFKLDQMRHLRELHERTQRRGELRSEAKIILHHQGSLPALLHDALGGGGVASLRNDPQGKALAQMLKEAKEASERFAKEGNVKVTWERLWQIEPRPFHPELIELCDAAIKETVPKSRRLPSGPLHDAAETCGAGVPTVMMFVQSLHGISHNKIEDTKEAHLELCVTAFDKLASKALAWVQKGGTR